jgi:predicted nuclease of restriction endonuclease-like (RecB) superfamily
MVSDLRTDKEYKVWLAGIKLRIRSVQLKAAVTVNSELLRFYWSLGSDIVTKQATAKWGDGLLSQLSRDLMAEFPEMKGFSLSNLKYIKQWYLFYSGQVIGQQLVGQFAKQRVSQIPADEFGQRVVAQITAIPWGHNIAVVAKCKDVAEALYYVQNTLAHNWSRSGGLLVSWYRGLGSNAVMNHSRVAPCLLYIVYICLIGLKK